MHSADSCRKLSLIVLLCLAGCLFGAPAAFAQGKQAIVILQPATGAAGASANCEGATEINYQIVYDLKLNNEDGLRLANSLSAAGPAASVSRKDYEGASKSKLKDLYGLRWEANGLLTAVSVAGQTPIPAVPENMKPQKNTEQPLASFYSVMVSGEAREGKQKRKLQLALREVWKIYFVPDGAAVNDTLFRHAVEEKSVALWEAFFKKTNNYRSAEANTFMREALITCARADLESFSNGDYGALEKARQRAGRAQSVRADEVTRQLAVDIRQAQEKVDATRNQVEQLIRADRWDDAINTAAPIKIYLRTWPDLNDMYTHALKSSHDIHLFEGEKALHANQLEAARTHCTTAWQRLPDSGLSDAGLALKCVCEARNQIALRDSHNLRQQQHPKEAKALLEAQMVDGDCSPDTRVATALRETNCEYAQQLLAEARQLVVGRDMATNSPVRPGAVGNRRAGRAVVAASPRRASTVSTTAVNLKAITAQNKQEFRAAHAKLVLASQLCPDETVRAALDATNQRLSEFCLEEARKAMQRGHFGTAYVYLQTARGYTPNDGNVSGLLAQVQERFQRQVRVSIGVVLENSAGGNGEQVLNEVAAGVESVVSRVGLAQAIILDRREAANALRSIQGNREASGPTIIFSGELLSADIRRSEDPRNVRSSFSYANPSWEAADRTHDATNAEYKRCVKQSGAAACTGLAERVASQRAYRDQFPRNITEEYSYRETSVRMEGSLRMSFRATDSISHSTRAADIFSAAVNQQCVRREGVNPRDNSARDTSCDMGDTQSYLFQMVEKIKGDAYTAAAAQLGALPLSYYARAHSATNRQQGIEDYLYFIFLTRDKSGNEVQEAQRLLVAFDPELSTDGVLR